MTEEDGIFRFPEDIERGPTSYQEMKFIVLWEALGETPLWEVFWEAQSVTDNGDEQVALGQRVVRETIAEGLLELIKEPWLSDEPAEALGEEEVERALRDVTLRDPRTAGSDPPVLRVTEAWNAWRRTHE